MDLLYIVIISTFIMIKLSSVLFESIDPFQPLEQIVTTVALGGLWDNMRVEEEVVVQEEEEEVIDAEMEPEQGGEEETQE